KPCRVCGGSGKVGGTGGQPEDRQQGPPTRSHVAHVVAPGLDDARNAPRRSTTLHRRRDEAGALRERCRRLIAVSKGGLKKQRCSVVPEAWHLTTDEDEEFLAFYRSWQG